MTPTSFKFTLDIAKIFLPVNFFHYKIFKDPEPLPPSGKCILDLLKFIQAFTCILPVKADTLIVERFLVLFT